MYPIGIQRSVTLQDECGILEPRRRVVEVVASEDVWEEITQGRGDEFDPAAVVAVAVRRGEPGFAWLQMAIAQVEIKPRAPSEAGFTFRLLSLWQCMMIIAPEIVQPCGESRYGTGASLPVVRRPNDHASQPQDQQTLLGLSELSLLSWNKRDFR